MKCKYEGCTNDRAYPDQPFCATHRLRWIAGQSPEPTPLPEPRWLTWTREHRQAKDLTAA